jgi:hypothetical protein
MGVEIQLFEVGAYRSVFCLWGWMKSVVCEETVNTREELVARIKNSAALLKQESQVFPSFALCEPRHNTNKYSHTENFVSSGDACVQVATPVFRCRRFENRRVRRLYFTVFARGFIQCAHENINPQLGYNRFVARVFEYISIISKGPLVKAAEEIPLETVRAVTSEWPERHKACVEA